MKCIFIKKKRTSVRLGAWISTKTFTETNFLAYLVTTNKKKILFSSGIQSKVVEDAKLVGSNLNVQIIDNSFGKREIIG